jgi:hypothetical protein
VRLAGSLIVLAFLIPRSLLAQTPRADIAGDWGNRFHEDLWERRSGLQIGDFTGFAFTEAGRRMAAAWHPSWFSIPENQCRPHTGIYGLRGPADLHITKITDTATGRVNAYQIAWSFGQIRTIWMDGRPHPPAYAPHTWAGFSTGVWDGTTLAVTTTHVKAGYLQRNGAPHSDEAVTREYWVRHGNMLLLTSIVDDPAYYEEPVIKTTNWMLQDVPNAPYFCGPAHVADEVVGHGPEYVPHYLPGENDLIAEFTSQRGVPLDAALGGRATLYPEYWYSALGTRYSESKRDRAPTTTGRVPSTEQRVPALFGQWTLSIAKSTFRNNLRSGSVSGADASAPQWRTMTFETSGVAVKHRTDTQVVANDTGFYRVEYDAAFDGRDYAVLGSTAFDHVALRQIDATTYERLGKDRGQVVETSRYKVSQDGRELTVTVDGISQGVEYHNIQIFERTGQ